MTRGVRRLFEVIVCLLSSGIVGGLLDGIIWPGPPLALFRPQLTMVLCAASLVALMLGSRRFAVVGIGAAGLGVALLVPTLRSTGPEPVSTGPVVRVLTLNLWRRNDDVAAVSELIARERPDIVALVELTPAWQRALGPVLRRYPIRALEASTSSSGIGVYGRAHLRGPEIVWLAEGRPAVEARLDVAGRVARLLVVHPTGGFLPGDVGAHERELVAIGRWAHAQGPRSVVCGDMNAAPWTRSLRDALAEGDLRAALPGGLFAGSWPALPPPLRVAIDGCLVGSGLRARARLGPRVGSDHLPVLIELG